MSNATEAGRSLKKVLQDLRDFRATQPQHDLSVFKYRNQGHPFCAGGWVADSEPVKPSKRRKVVASE